MLTCAASGRTPDFRGLGSLPGGSDSGANAVSGDGSVVVGWAQSTTGSMAFRWSAAKGMVSLGDLPGGDTGSEAWGASHDGSVVVGRAEVPNPNYGSGAMAFLWADATGMTGIEGPPGTSARSLAYDVSGSGDVVVGWSEAFGTRRQPFRWTQNDGMVSLGTWPGQTLSGCAWGVSSDGSTIVGHAGAEEAFRWTATTGMVSLGFLPGGRSPHSFALDSSSDGSVVVGYSIRTVDYNDICEAFRWTESGGMVGLGFLMPTPSFVPRSRALGVSADGNVIVGFAGTASGGKAAFIWDPQHQMRAIKDVLVGDCALDLSGWDLISATGVSDDGSVIAGVGYNPAGRMEAWVATIPEPATLLLLALGACLPLRRRCR